MLTVMETHIAETLPPTDPMMVRLVVPIGRVAFVGGVVVLDTFEIGPVEMVANRLPYDEPIVDCSHRIFQITTAMMSNPDLGSVVVFPSRRWRNLREGEQITGVPSRDTPLLYLGNPIQILRTNDGLKVVSSPEFLIRTGVELGY